MELTRTEILPGVWLSYLRSDKFKTACLSVSLLTQLKRETAAINALIPYVLRRGTRRYGDMEALSARMDELYGTAIEPVVRRIGEIQCLGFYASIPERDFLPDGQDVLRDAAELLGELLLAPNTRGGLLLPQYVDSEREKMLETIRSRINEKRGYALFRCIEEMCCCEDFAVGRLGGESECESIRYKKLTQQYHTLLQTCPIELFYCGRAEEKQVVALLRDALATLPRGEIDYEIGTDVRMNALEEQPRTVEERAGRDAGQAGHRLAPGRVHGGAGPGGAVCVQRRLRRRQHLQALHERAREAAAVLLRRLPGGHAQGAAARLLRRGVQRQGRRAGGDLCPA